MDRSPTPLEGKGPLTRLATLATLSLGERVARCPDALHREAGWVRGYLGGARRKRLLDNLAFCFTREGQDEQAQNIDQGDGAGSARKSSEVNHEVACQERSGGGKDAACVKAESGSCGSDARGKISGK